MKNYFKICCFLLTGLFLTSEDCSNSSPEPMVKNSPTDFYKELEMDFKTSALSPGQLAAFEKRSLQMLEDLIDCLNFYADTSKPVEFRKHTRNLISEMFTTEQDLDLFFELMQIKEDKTNHSIRFIYAGQNVLEIDSMDIAENLNSTENETYSGKLVLKTSFENLSEVSSGTELYVNLSKIEKQFGGEKDLVWKLLFSVK